jgi:hypothetical protein
MSELTPFQLAMTNPFFNGDIVSFIMKLCLTIGPRTAFMFASTHKFTLPYRSMISVELTTHYVNAREYMLRDGYT